MKFPVLAIHPKGFTWLFIRDTDTQRLPIAFVGVFRKLRGALEFFDSDGEVWMLESVEPTKRLPFWSRLLPSLREIDVTIRFLALRGGSVDRMKQLLRRAVEADDDLLTQHHDREDILAKLDATKSIGEVFRLYRWTMKDFRKGPAR